MSVYGERTMLVKVTIGSFTQNRADSDATADVIEKYGAEVNAGKFIKTLLNHPSMDAYMQNKNAPSETDTKS